MEAACISTVHSKKTQNGGAGSLLLYKGSKMMGCSKVQCNRLQTTAATIVNLDCAKMQGRLQ